MVDKLKQLLHRPLNTEALAATAFTFGVWILELEAFIDTLFYKIHFRTIDVDQALGVDNDFDSPIFEDLVTCLETINKFEHIGHA